MAGGSNFTRYATKVESAKTTGSKVHSLLNDIEVELSKDETIIQLRENNRKLMYAMYKLIVTCSPEVDKVFDLTEAEKGLQDLSKIALYLEKFEAGKRVAESDMKGKIEAASTLNSYCIGLRAAVGISQDDESGWYDTASSVASTWVFVNTDAVTKGHLLSCMGWMKSEGGSSGAISSATLLNQAYYLLDSYNVGGNFPASIGRTVGGKNDGPLAINVALTIARRSVTGSRHQNDERKPARNLLRLYDEILQNPARAPALRKIIESGSGASDAQNMFTRDKLVQYVMLCVKSWVVQTYEAERPATSVDVNAAINMTEKDFTDIMVQLGAFFISPNVSKSCFHKTMKTLGKYFEAISGNCQLTDLGLHCFAGKFDAKRLAASLTLAVRCPSESTITNSLFLRPLDGIKDLCKMIKIEKQDPTAKIHSSGHALHRCLALGGVRTDCHFTSMLTSAPSDVKFLFVNKPGVAKELTFLKEPDDKVNAMYGHAQGYTVVGATGINADPEDTEYASDDGMNN